jgi:benzoyl-CoA reductase/2-hydroxyglutaryl-CoA dehydratase subunit BcrC/BadD/HgdB
METERLARQRKTAALHLGMETAEVLRKVNELPNRCSSLDYFSRKLTEFAGSELPGEPGARRIGTMCVQVPDELIYAAGARPFRLCSGAYAFDQVGAEFLPAKSCPTVRATLGSLYMEQEERSRAFDAVVVPSTCDQKRKAAESLSAMGYKVHILEMPATKDGELAIDYWRRSVKNFALELERLCGNKITRKSLNRALAGKTQAAELFRRLQQFRQAEHPMLYGVDLFIVMNCYFVDHVDDWCEAVSKLLEELDQKKRQGESVGNRGAARVVFTGSPAIFPHLKVPLLIEENGALIVGDESCSATRLLHDAVAFAEPHLYDMLPALADRYLKPCTCPCLTPNKDRLRRIAELVHNTGAEGVVYQSFSGCMPYELEQRAVAKMLDELGVPMLFLETDFSPEDVGQLSTRIEAFLESIKNRRRRKKE